MRHATRIAKGAKLHAHAETAAGRKYLAALAALPVRALARALEPTLRAHLAALGPLLARRKKPATYLDVVWVTNAPTRAELRLDDVGTGLRLDVSAIAGLPSRPRFVGPDGDGLRYVTSLKLAEVLAVAFERLRAEVTGLQRAPLLCRSFNTALGAPALFFGDGDDDD